MAPGGGGADGMRGAGEDGTRGSAAGVGCDDGLGPPAAATAAAACNFPWPPLHISEKCSWEQL